MKVILLDYVYKHGVAGEVIDVADGFARNYLIPKKLAVQATESELKRAKKLREQAAAKRAMLEDRMNEIARQIDGVELIFGRRAASTGKLFGSVTSQDIADELMTQTGIDINRRRVSQQGVREIGTHEVTVRLGNEIAPVLRVIVVREDELEEFLAAREAGEDVEVPTAEGDAPAGEPVAETVVEQAQEMAASAASAVTSAVESAAETVTEAVQDAAAAVADAVSGEDDESAEAPDDDTTDKA